MWNVKRQNLLVTLALFAIAAAFFVAWPTLAEEATQTPRVSPVLPENSWETDGNLVRDLDGFLEEDRFSSNESPDNEDEKEKEEEEKEEGEEEEEDASVAFEFEPEELSDPRVSHKLNNGNAFIESFWALAANWNDPMTYVIIGGAVAGTSMFAWAGAVIKHAIDSRHAQTDLEKALEVVRKDQERFREKAEKRAQLAAQKEQKYLKELEALERMVLSSSAIRDHILSLGPEKVVAHTAANTPVRAKNFLEEVQKELKKRSVFILNSYFDRNTGSRRERRGRRRGQNPGLDQLHAARRDIEAQINKVKLARYEAKGPFDEVHKWVLKRIGEDGHGMLHTVEVPQGDSPQEQSDLGLYVHYGEQTREYPETEIGVAQVSPGSLPQATKQGCNALFELVANKHKLKREEKRFNSDENMRTQMRLLLTAVSAGVPAAFAQWGWPRMVGKKHASTTQNHQEEVERSEIAAEALNSYVGLVTQNQADLLKFADIVRASLKKKENKNKLIENLLDVLHSTESSLTDREAIEKWFDGLLELDPELSDQERLEEDKVHRWLVQAISENPVEESPNGKVQYNAMLTLLQVKRDAEPSDVLKDYLSTVLNRFGELMVNADKVGVQLDERLSQDALSNWMTVGTIGELREDILLQMRQKPNQIRPPDVPVPIPGETVPKIKENDDSNSGSQDPDDPKKKVSPDEKSAMIEPSQQDSAEPVVIPGETDLAQAQK